MEIEKNVELTHKDASKFLLSVCRSSLYYKPRVGNRVKP